VKAQIAAASEICWSGSSGEPRQVVGVNQLEVGDVVAVAAVAVGVTRGLHCVEGHAHCPVPDRVQVHLEVQRVQSGDRRAEQVGRDVGQPGRGAVAAVAAVGLQQCASVVFDHAVDHDLAGALFTRR
jgi:hypothetical protein